MLPTLLNHAGVDFFQLGGNAASYPPRLPMLFFGEGPNGLRLLTVDTGESRGAGLVLPPT